jgi:hypothetical protein
VRRQLLSGKGPRHVRKRALLLAELEIHGRGPACVQGPPRDRRPDGRCPPG